MSVTAKIFCLSLFVFSVDGRAGPLADAEERARFTGKLESFVRYYRKHIHRGVDVMPFFAGRPAAERNRIKGLMVHANHMPPLRRENGDLIFSVEDEDLRVQFPDPVRPQFVLAGVKMTLDPSAPRDWQLQLFMNKFLRAADSSVGVLDLLFPKAHAMFTVPAPVKKKFWGTFREKVGMSIIGATSGMVGAGGVSFFKDSGLDITCTTMTVTFAMKNVLSNYWCGNWMAKNAQIASANAKRQIGYLDDLMKSLQIRETRQFDCPPISADGKSAITVDLRMQDGADVPRWFRFSGDIEKGEIKKANIFRVDDPEKLNPTFELAGAVSYLPTEGVNKEPMRISVPAEPNDKSVINTTKGSTPYLSTDVMPSTDVNTYKEAVVARQLIALAAHAKIMTINCRQKVEKVDAPAGLRNPIKAADVIQ